jgi:hypothetical protein
MIDFLELLIPDFLIGISKLLLQIFIIILAILVGLEILKALKILDFLNKLLYKVTRYIGISKSASLPLFVGLLAGITYGAGSIIASYKNNEMTKRDVYLVSIFMCLCHALIEDTIIFATLGGNGWIIVAFRFGLALIVTMFTNLYFITKEKSLLKER